MVKVRPGSRKGQTKLNNGAKKAARRNASKAKGNVHSKSVIHPVMRSTWNKKQSHVENLSRVGLQASVNHVKKSRVTMGRKIEVGVERVSVQCPETLAELIKEASIPEAKPKQIVHPGEKRALTAMVEKHGDNWLAMSRDIKLNYLQWTPNQLERKVTRMQEILNA